MCGICGLWLTEERVAARTVIAMRESIAHRGPDGAGGVLLSSRGRTPVPFEEHAPDSDDDHDLGFGHRRLAIIDPAGGRQPIAGRDGQVWLIYNGEIYNYRELGAELARAGHAFRTRCDTEVLLRAYEQYGTECVEHLNGIFSFAIWDGAQRRLFLARDPFGVKPLYWAQTARGFAFGSEVKAILASGLIRAGLDLDALGMILTFRHAPSPATLFSGVHRLAPGASLTVQAGAPPQLRFYAETVAPRRGRPVRRVAAELATGIDGAVRRQMVSDVPIGLSLSSGVDSTTLLALMSRATPEAVRAFTIGFADDGGAGEVPRARVAAGRHGARFEAREVRDDDYRALMARYMWHLEEPIGNQSAPAYYFVAEMAGRAGAKVLLTGQGADELFAGYDRHAAVAFARALRLGAAPWLRTPLTALTGGTALGEKYRRLLAGAAAGSPEERLLGAYAALSRDEIAALLRPEVHAEIDWERPLAHVGEWLARAPGGTALERMLWIDARTTLADNLLLAEDKMGMAASVEVRVPLLDLEFARLAESVPGSMKLTLGQRKRVYRRACARWIGVRASRRRQIGFVNPMAAWLRHGGERPLLDDLADPASFLARYLEPDRVRTLVREHTERRRDHTRILFLLASLQGWHETFAVR